MMNSETPDLPHSAPVIDCAACAGGVRVADVGIDQIQGVLARSDQFIWLGLYEPDQALLRRVQQQFGLHDLAIEDTINAHQRPKLELYEDSVFVVLRTAQLTAGGHLEFGETHAFVGRNYIVTVRRGSLRSHIGVRQRCELTPHLLSKGPGYVLYALMDFVVDQYLPIVQRLDESVQELEAHLSLMSVAQNEDMKRITAWAAMIAVPTMIAGVYGMNFAHMPELQWEYGYYLSLAVMVVACVGLFLGFRRSGWL